MLMWRAALCAVASCSSDLGCVQTTAGPAERCAPVASTELTSALSVRRRLPESLGYFGRSHRRAQGLLKPLESSLHREKPDDLERGRDRLPGHPWSLPDMERATPEIHGQLAAVGAEDHLRLVIKVF